MNGGEDVVRYDAKSHEIEISGILLFRDGRWITSLSDADKAVAEDEAAFRKRFRSDWNGVQRIALLRLKQECDLTDPEIKALIRKGAIHRTAEGARFRGDAFMALFGRIAFLLLLLLWAVTVWGLPRSPPSWQSVIGFVGISAACGGVCWYLHTAFISHWIIFGRCVIYRERMKSVLGEGMTLAESRSSGVRPEDVQPASATAVDETDADESERVKLLKQIGALALVLAKQKGKYVWGNKPNASRIAEECQSILDSIPDESEEIQLRRRGTGKSELRNSIAEGIALLTADN